MKNTHHGKLKGAILKSVIILLSLVVTLSGIALLFLIWLDAANPKWVVEKSARAFADRNLTIKGDLNIYVFSLNPGIKAQNIVVKSPRELIKAEDFEGRLDLGDYLRGRIIITKLNFINGLINIVKPKPSAITLELLVATKSAEVKNTYINLYKTYSGKIRDLSINYAANGQTNIQGNGTFQSLPVHLHGKVQIEKSKIYPKRPFEIYVQMEQIHVALVGWVLDRNSSLNAQLAIIAKNPAHLLAALDLNSTPLPSFKFTADLAYQNNTLTSKDYKFLFGKTYAYGDFTFRKGNVPFISMDTTFNPLRYQDIESLIRIKNQLTHAPQKEKQARRKSFLNNPLPFNVLHKYQGHLKIYIKDYQSPQSDLLFKAGILKAHLKEGHLNLISAAKIAKGITAARIDIIAAKVPRLDAKVKISKIDTTNLAQGIIHKISSEEFQPKKIGGTLNGFAKLRSNGRSPEDLISHLSGKIKLVMEDGYIGSLTNVNSQLAIIANNPGHILATFNLNPGPLPPLKLTANLAYQNNTLTSKDYKFSFGKTYAYGDFTFRRGNVPFISMDTTFNPLRHQDIANLLKIKKQLTNESKKGKQKQAERKTLFNDNPLPFNLLHKYQGHLKIYIKEYQSTKPDLLFKRGILKVNLDEGHLNLISAAKIAKGIIATHMGIIAAKVPRLDATIKISDFNITELAQKFIHQKPPEILRPKKVIGGKLDGFAKLKSKGYSIEDFANHLEGNLKLAMGKGYIGSLITAALSLHIPKAVISWIENNPPADINCMLVSTNINSGKVNTPTIFISSDRANVVGSGTANLKKGTLRYTFRSFPKDFSIKAALPIVVIEGNLMHPKVDVVTKHVVLTVITAILEPIISGIEDIFTTINPSKKCQKLFDEIKRIQKKSKIPPSSVKAEITS